MKKEAIPAGQHVLTHGAYAVCPLTKKEKHAQYIGMQLHIIEPFEGKYCMVGHGLGMRHFCGLDEISVPECAGIYLFANVDGDDVNPLYWGQAINLHKRIKEHFADPNDKINWLNCNRLYYMECASQEQLDPTEAELIMWYPTPYNERLNPLYSKDVQKNKLVRLRLGLAPEVSQLRDLIYYNH